MSVKNSVFNITDENSSFSISIPGYWRFPNYLEVNIIDKQKNLLKLKSGNDIELHVQEVRKKVYQIKIGDKENKLSNFDTSKKILEEIKSSNYHDLEDLVYRMQLAYVEVIDILDTKSFPSERTGYTLLPGIYEISDINKTTQGLLSDIVKISITIVDIRLKSNLEFIQTFISTKKSFFNTILEFTQSKLGPLGDIDGVIQLIPGSYKSIEPIRNYWN